MDVVKRFGSAQKAARGYFSGRCPQEHLLVEVLGIKRLELSRNAAVECVWRDKGGSWLRVNA